MRHLGDHEDPWQRFPELELTGAHSLGIDLAKTLSLNYSNQETSVTVGESVRDEDGMFGPPSRSSRSQ